MSARAMSTGPVSAARVALKLTQTEVATRAGLPNAFLVCRLETGEAQPNHPVIPLVASVLNLAPEVISEHQRGEAMSEQRVARAAALLSGDIKRAKPRRSRSNGHRPGTALELRAKVVVPSPRLVAALQKARGTGTLAKKFEKTTRQCARALISTVNVHLMRGKSHADLEHVPLEELGVIVNDWLALNGIKPLVLTQSFAGVFD